MPDIKDMIIQIHKFFLLNILSGIIGSLASLYSTNKKQQNKKKKEPNKNKITFDDHLNLEPKISKQNKKKKLIKKIKILLLSLKLYKNQYIYIYI